MTKIILVIWTVLQLHSGKIFAMTDETPYDVCNRANIPVRECNFMIQSCQSTIEECNTRIAAIIKEWPNEDDGMNPKQFGNF